MLLPVASQFIAGEDVESALEYGDKLHEVGICPMYNYLGEHHKEEREVDRTVSQYFQLLDSMSTGAISLKPSQLGLDIDRELFARNAKALVKEASTNDVFTWFDMEKRETVPATLDVYEEVISEYPGEVGVCIQANLHRSIDDVERLCSSDGASVRVVKGAYREPEHVSYTDDDAINENYLSLVERVTGEVEIVAVATHDEEILRQSLDIVQGVDGQEFEVQMLSGVREERQRELAKQGISVSQYAPYGSEWLSYTYRRIRENPKNIMLLGRAVIEKLKS